MLESVKASLERLNTDFIDLYYIHWPRTDMDIRPAMEGLELARAQGLVRAVGVSNFTVAQMKTVAQAIVRPLQHLAIRWSLAQPGIVCALAGANNPAQVAQNAAALDKIVLGAARPLAMDVKDRRVIAYHEAGHAIAAWFTPEADPVHKVTIIPHGLALGVTEQIIGEDKYNYGQGYLLARLAVMMGGRVAEELAIGEITTGAENDLKEATHLARKMVTRWAMTDFGLMTLDAVEEQPFLGYEITQGRGYSEASAARSDEKVQELLRERYEFTRLKLKDKRSALDTLVEALMECETVTQEEMEKLIGPRG
jgi:cell division protease FtsH